MTIQELLRSFRDEEEDGHTPTPGRATPANLYIQEEQTTVADFSRGAVMTTTAVEPTKMQHGGGQVTH